MRQTHAAGERLFVDYAGDGVPVVVDRLTGEIRLAQIFCVAVLGASSFTFAHASWTQALPDWIDAHVRALEAIGSVPQLLVPDNTKTAVIKACLYDPQVNRTYAEMAAHYGAAILPARPRRPRGTKRRRAGRCSSSSDGCSGGCVTGVLSHSLVDVSAAIADLMTHLNEHHPIRATARRNAPALVLEEVDRPALTSLPAEPYEFSEWRVADRHRLSRRGRRPLQSCPSLRAEVDARRGGRRDSSRASGSPHMCASGNHLSTPPSPACRPAIGATPAGRSSARLIGAATAALCELILEGDRIPSRAFAPA